MQFNQERVLERLFKMIKIDSVTKSEGNMTDFLQKYFEDLGYEVYRDEAGKAIGGDHAGNLLLHIPGTIEGEAICLNAHQDTVEPGIGIEPVFENGIVKSASNTILAADDKSGIAMMMEIHDRLKETGIAHRDLWFLFTIAEENGLLGSKNFDYDRLPAKNILALDAAGYLGDMLISGAGKDDLKATFHGKMAHGGIEPEKGISSIAMLANAIDRVKFGRIDSETTSNLGIIEGGIANNIVCDKASFTCEVRSHSANQITEQIELIKKACYDASAQFGGTVDVEVDHFCPPHKPDLEGYLTKAMHKALELEGITPVYKVSNGAGDANIFSGHGFNCTNITTGMFAVHTTDEYLDMSVFAQAFNVVWRIITDDLN